MSCEKLKQIIINMVEQLDEADVRFLNQMYTIIKRHLARRGDISLLFLFANFSLTLHWHLSTPLAI